jgi:hypothetical protein
MRFIVIVGKTAAADGLGVRVAQHRCVTTELLHTRQEAPKWARRLERSAARRIDTKR